MARAYSRLGCPAALRDLYVRPLQLDGLDDAGPGLVGVLAQESARFSMFAASMTDLQMPAGSTVKWRFGWDLAQAHNALIGEMLDRDLDWIWIMGDDHVFSPDILAKLLDHDADIVVPLCLMRNAPYRPVVWVDHPGGEPNLVKRIDLANHPEGGLIEVAAAGSAGMLIRRSVFEFVEEPWFEAGGDLTNRVGEDVYFCRKARAAGLAIYCDLDSVIGHCSTTVVWPVREHDGWTFAFSMMGGFEVTMPPSFQSYADQIGS